MKQPPRLPASFASAVDLSSLNKPTAATNKVQTGGNPYVIDVTEETFEVAVIQESSNVPVVIDFWAEWCGPCKQLSPVLEKLALEGKGKWLLAKVDTEAAPALAQAFRIQSIPTVIAVVNGQLAPLFQGAHPEAQVREVITQLLSIAAQQGVKGTYAANATPDSEIIEEEEIDPDESAALLAIDSGDFDQARAAYQRLLARKPQDIDATIGLAQVELLARVKNLDPAAVTKQSQENPTDLTLQQSMADIEMVSGKVEAAFARLIELVKQTSGDDRNKVKEHLLGLFNLVDPADPRVIASRRALANALF